MRFGGGHIGQPQRALIKVLVGEEVGQAHGGGIVSDVGAELLRDTGTALNDLFYTDSIKAHFALFGY